MAEENTDSNGTTTQQAGTPAWVDERISKITRQRDEMADRVTTLEREVEKLSPLADRADAWKEKAQTLETSLSTEQAKWHTDRALLEAGIQDREVRELFQWQHTRLPEKDRPAFGDWLGGLQADDAQVPAVLAPYIGSTESTESTEAAPPPPAAKGMPPGNAGTRIAPTPSKEPSLAEISGSSDEAWKQMREQMVAQYKRGRS